MGRRHGVDHDGSSAEGLRLEPHTVQLVGMSL
jgi:hypothetical protein